MKRLKSLVVVCLAGIMAACLFFCCSKIHKDKVVYKNPISQISLSWWGTDIRHEYMLDGVRNFEAEHTDIDVECIYGVWEGFERRNRMAMASRTPADVMLVNFNWLDEYSPDGHGYYDLYTLENVIDLTQYDKEDLKIGEKNGHLNAIPIAYNSTIFFFNENIYGKYGLEIPKTWDDLLAAAKVMKADGIYPIGMVRKHFFISMMAYYEQKTGKRFFNEDGSLNVDEEGIKDILLFYKNMVDAGAIAPVGVFDTNDFIKGKTAGIVAWINDGSKYGKSLEASGGSIICSDFITMDGAKLCGWYKKPATLYAICSNTSNPEEAGKLLNYLLNDSEMAKIQGIDKGFPISRAAMAAVEKHTDMPAYAKIANELIRDEDHKLGIMTPEMENSEVIDSFKDGTDKFIYGKANLDEAASEILENMEIALEKIKKNREEKSKLGGI